VDHKTEFCLNCVASLKNDKNTYNNFCPNCGQKNTTLKLKFSEVFSEAISAVFSFESKFYKSLFTLFLKPGKITYDYIIGKRIKYVNPFRLYILSGFLNVIFLTIFFLSFKGFDHKILSVDEENTYSLNILKENEKDKRSALMTFYLPNKDADRSSTLKYIDDNLKLHLNITAAQYIKNLLRSVSYLNFLLIPILALIVFLFYLKKSNYLETLIYATHIFTLQNFLTILFVLIFFLSRILPQSLDIIVLILALVVLLYFIIYTFLSLRKFKKEKILLLSLKFLGINLIFPVIYFVALALSIVMSVTVL